MFKLFSKKPKNERQAGAERDVLGEVIERQHRSVRAEAQAAATSAPEAFAAAGVAASVPGVHALGTGFGPAFGGDAGQAMVLRSPVGGAALDRIGAGATAMAPVAGPGSIGETPAEITAGIDPKVLKLLTPQFAHEMQAIPLRVEGDKVIIAVHETPTRERQVHMHWLVNSSSERKRNLQFTQISRELLRQCLDIYYPWSSNVQLIPSANDLVRLFMDTAAQQGQQVMRAKDLGGQVSVRNLVIGILMKAVHRGAADVLFEPGDTEFRIRFKVEGECELACTPLPPNAGPQILSVIKQLGEMDIAEREKTQDGKFSWKMEVRGGVVKDIQFRVAITPTVNGEECTIRLHDNSEQRHRIDALKADPRTQDALWRVVNTKRGFVLLCGPTGSGKTTTLAAVLSECDSEKERIVTIEDPVEIRLPGVSQTSVNEKKDESFPRLVRNALRRAPDRILIGEIRDEETAHYAIKGASTGHQVLSTVHADYAAQVVSRLLQEKVSPFNLASTLTLVVAQRLLNVLCERCAVPVEYDTETLLREQFVDFEIPEIRAREAHGCAICHHKVPHEPSAHHHA